MSKSTSRWLNTRKRFEGQKPGNALVKWLNEPDFDPKLVEELVLDAQLVFRYVAEYGSLRELNVARKQNKLPAAFWDCHQRLNETLAKFTFAPQIDLHEFPDGERVSWFFISEESPIDLLSVQVRYVLQLVQQGAILKIRRCQQCAKWYFARFSHQEFCTTKCRSKHLAGSSEFREKRRKYMREYNRLQKSGKVK